MLFNSYFFIFCFLPISALLFYFLGKYNLYRIAKIWLITISLVFYGWWNPKYLILLLSSIAFNYTVGYILGKSVSRKNRRSKSVLIIGIVGNLALLAYYKYAYFFIGNISTLLGRSIHLSEIILPLGISFFTFTQIAYLADVYKGQTKEYSFLSYILFVTFFPHLIAGPILHHKEMMPQFADKVIYRINWQNIALGTVIFIMGLFKKVIIADNLAGFATPVFSIASHGAHVDFLESWAGALGYSLQLYFDFSGYSDMAIGLALMFNIKLPINFFSPYKSASIIEFWRRWHMTLSRYLRDYLYIPLGGNRKGVTRRYINLMVTMILGGLWHGAGWTFVLWGTLHGLYLIINHFWRWFTGKVGLSSFSGKWYTKTTSQALTFIAIVFAWVIFRSTDIGTAIRIIKGMCGLNGISLPENIYTKFEALKYYGFQGLGFMPNTNLPIKGALPWIMGSLIIVFFAPNVIEITAKYEPAIGISRANIKTRLAKYFEWSPSPLWALLIGITAGLAIIGISRASEFLYFQF